MALTLHLANTRETVVGLRGGFDPPDLERPGTGRLPHQQGLGEARLRRRPPLSLQTTAECLVTVLLSGAHSGVKHLLGLTCTSQGARGYAEKTRDVHFFRWLRWITQVVCPAPKLLLAISLPQYRPVGRHCGSLRGTDTISHNDVASRCSMKYY